MTALAVERIEARDMEIMTKVGCSPKRGGENEAYHGHPIAALPSMVLGEPARNYGHCPPPGAETIVMEMEDDAFELFLGRIRKEGGSLAEWLISSDDFVTDITID
jgi:hypothetical protein